LLDEWLSTPGGAVVGSIELDPAWDSIRGSVEFQTMRERHR
jgi:hypothetical protein